MHTNFHENDYLINLTCHKCYLYSRNMFEISHEIHLVDFLVLYIYQKLILLKIEIFIQKNITKSQ